MKKLIILACCIIVVMTGCEKSPSTISSSLDVGDSRVEETASPTLAEQMKITEYTCIIDDSFRYYVMFIRNESDKTVSVETNITAKDSEDKPIGAYSDSVLAIAPMQTSCIWTTFDEGGAIKGFDYTLSVSEENRMKSIYDDVTIDYNLTNNKIVASATNSGDKSADFVWLNVVFLKDGEMVGFCELSLMNNNSQLPPGTTLSAEGELYSETGFDDVVVALNGRVK